MQTITKCFFAFNLTFSSILFANDETQTNRGFIASVMDVTAIASGSYNLRHYKHLKNPHFFDHINAGLTIFNVIGHASGLIGLSDGLSKITDTLLVKSVDAQYSFDSAKQVVTSVVSIANSYYTIRYTGRTGVEHFLSVGNAGDIFWNAIWLPGSVREFISGASRVASNQG